MGFLVWPWEPFPVAQPIFDIDAPGSVAPVACVQEDRGGELETQALIQASPVFPFLDAMAGSIERVAPEKADMLLQMLNEHQIRLVVDQDLKRIFRARVTDGRPDICCSIFGAEVLWAAALAYVTVHKHFKDNVGNTLAFKDEPTTEIFPRLLDFAFNQRVGNRCKDPWPEEFPGPRLNRPGQEIDHVNLATELWLVALAWILHHELAHIRLGHLQRTDERIEDEIAADEHATDWLLGGVDQGVFLKKRSLGIAIAVVTLVGFALHRGARSLGGNRTHPPAGERILRALSHPALPDEHHAQEFAAVAVKLHMDGFGLDAPKQHFKNASDCLAAYCRTLVDWELQRS